MSGQPDQNPSPPLPFSLGYDDRDEEEIMRRWRAILRSNKWSHAAQLEEFEAAWRAWNELPAVAFDNWAGGAMAVLDHFKVRGATVLCPSNTFLATPRAAQLSGAEVVFYDCNRHDLCGSFDDFVAKAERHRPALAFIVHIGGHIAFDIHKIASYCRDKGIILVEDCAHAVGADWNGQKPGSFGDAGIFSLYATKTITTGEGGVVVSRHEDVLRHARSYRDYGRGSGYKVQSLNHRMDEFRAAFGTVQIRRMPEIVAWKQAYARDVLDPLYPDRVRLPEGMSSGFYKYIVFQNIPTSTGKVYELPCHRIMGVEADLPNTEWVAKNHWCVPLYYPRPSLDQGSPG
ncbi:DegT/DnrJ/EryC1/StrS family aminotransferase [Nitrospirillum amazonense]|uniref:DegT/DnrJ/EryC1/StrS family aminotransferase n=1 Tax=Nitrospirillum amazonense TaxID=28077 RepID=UPI0024127A33|nr:DegT/DnrJ/EryC1/StrS family aminotransferase [Nitrospirillum amazonense]MDG3438990.1 DegT/DnrJ/EryC1/StrS family aminotransferase [Nitrospirillum amazonense]